MPGPIAGPTEHAEQGRISHRPRQTLRTHGAAAAHLHRRVDGLTPLRMPHQIGMLLAQSIGMPARPMEAEHSERGIIRSASRTGDGLTDIETHDLPRCS